ncbi:ROK family protein [Crossiella equi]|uniref:ROK family protein n=1 Tax=Crossiella equi TaxID=130796 RepID=UPI001302D01D|nr:ROK family protein [Crossiella equi]
MDAGWILAVTLNQSGVHTRATDLAATPRHDHHVPPGAPGDTQALVTALRTAVGTAVRANRGPLRAVAVSVANPVHPATREVVPLPGSPFPEGLLNPGSVLADLTSAPVLVDNDVNLAALAERHSVAAAAVSTFAYLYVGAGLGLGLYLGDRLLRGAHGLAGEIGYLPGAGEEGLAAELTGLGFGRGDVDKVLSVLDGQSGAERERAVGVLGEAITRAVVSVLAVADPELVLLGGPVGTHPALIGPVRAAVASRFPGPARISHGSLGARAPLHGAVHLAVEHARAEAVRAPGR